MIKLQYASIDENLNQIRSIVKDHPNALKIHFFLRGHIFAVKLGDPFKKEITAFMYAVNSNKIESCKVLLELGANINEQDPEGYTALQLASKNNQLEMIEFLIHQK